MIQVNETEPQVLTPNENFFIKNPEQFIRGKPKSQSVMVKEQIFKRNPTIDTKLTEKIANNDNFDSILEELNLNKFIKHKK